MTAATLREEAGRRVEYAVLSDVHLTELLSDSEPGWWEYKSPEASQDGALCEFMRAIETQRPRSFEATVLVFNGDTFDFDSVFSGPAGERVSLEGVPSDGPGSLFKMGRILDDHPTFVYGLSAFLAAGNSVVFVMGNHDRELCFPEVQEALVDRIVRAAPPGTSSRVAAAITFEPWFLHVPGVLFIEHGQQYDSTCSYRDVLNPLLPPDGSGRSLLEMSFGSVMARKVLCRVGTFNPYNDESFLLSLAGYARHMLRHYFPRRGFIRHYLRATLMSVIVARRARRRALRATKDTTSTYRDFARSHAVDAPFIDLLKRLASPPLVDRFNHLVHELWWDRFAGILLIIGLLALGVAQATTLAHGLALFSLLPLLVVLARTMGRGSLALQERGRWGLVAEEISQHLGVPLVAFGHSHRPERRPLARGGYYFNLGSWAPICEEDRSTTFERARRFLIVRPATHGVYVAFQRWSHGEVLPY